MNIIRPYIEKIMEKGRMLLQKSSKKGFGINEIIGIAAGVIIAVIIVVPGLKSFATTVMTKLNTWWESMASLMFG
jgi:hypothetical protein